jgi:hypothetical protein
MTQYLNCLKLLKFLRFQHIFFKNYILNFRLMKFDEHFLPEETVFLLFLNNIILQECF